MGGVRVTVMTCASRPIRIGAISCSSTNIFTAIPVGDWGRTTETGWTALALRGLENVAKRRGSA
jgi:hypothetical protein